MEDIFPSQDIFPTQPTPRYNQRDLESLALQFSLAQGDLSNENFSRNTMRLDAGGEFNMRQEIVDQENADEPAQKQALLDLALKEGKPDIATHIVQNGIPKSSIMTAMETRAAEEAAAIKINDEKEVVTPKDIGLSVRQNARLQMLNNSLARMRKHLENRYPEQQFRTETPKVSAVSPSGIVMLPRESMEAMTDPKAVTAALDFLGYLFNSTAVAAKSGFSAKFIVPGSTSKDYSQAFFDPEISDLEAQNMIDFLEKRVTDMFIDDPLARTNALRAITVWQEMLTTGSLDNPDLMAALLAKTYINEQGVEQENIFHKIVDPDSFVQRQFNKAWVQNITDNPIWDYTFFIGPATKVIGAAMGSTAAASILAQRLMRQTNEAEQFRHLTQLAYPGIQSPELLADIQKYLRDTEYGLAQAVNPARFDIDPVRGAQEASNIIGKEFKGGDVSFYQFRNDGANNFLDIYLRSWTGHHFADEQAVNSAALARGYNPTAFKAVPDPNGNGWLLRVSRTVDDTTWFDPDVPADLFKMSKIDRLLAVYNTFGRMAYSPNVNAPGQAFRASSAGAELTGYSKLFEQFHDSWQALDKKQMDRLGDIISMGKKEANPNNPRDLGRWYDEATLEQKYFNAFGKQISKEEKLAYYTFKMSSDLGYTLMDKRLYDELASKGVNSYKINNVGDRILARAVKMPTNPSRRSLFLLPNGRAVPFDQIPAAVKADPGNVILKVEGYWLHNNQPVTHIIAPHKGVTSGGLSRYILGYTEGGTRDYAHTWFSKVDMPGNNPATLAVHKSKKEALAWTRGINQIRQIYNRYIDDSKLPGANITVLRRNADNAIRAINSRWDVNKVITEISKGKFNPDKEVYALYNREPFPRIADELEGATELEMYQQGGRLYYSERGEHLIEGDSAALAELENPFEVLQAQQSHAARMAAYSNFAIKEMEVWASIYGRHGKWLVVPGVPHNEATLADFFMKGVWVPNPRDLPPHVQSMAEAQRMHIKRVLYMPTEQDAAIEAKKAHWAQNLAEFLGDSKFLPDWKILQKIKSGKSITQSDAVNAIKQANYDMVLALGQVDQAWVQSLGAWMAVAAHPIHGLPAVKDAMLLRLAAANDFNSIVVALMDKKLVTAGTNAVTKFFGDHIWYKEGEFTDMVVILKRSKILDPGKMDTVLDQAQSVSPIKGFAAATTRIREAGRIPVYEGERLGRLPAFGVAYRESKARIAAGEFAFGSDAHIAWVQGETNRLLNYMMKGGESFLQRNTFTSLFVQMQTWGLKTFEIFAGLNRSLTRGEKLRIVGFSTVLWGAHGFPFGPELLEKIVPFAAEALGIPPDEVTDDDVKLYMFGLVDATVKWIAEGAGVKADTALASRLGAGTTFTDIYKDIFEGDAPLIQMVTGLTGNMVAQGLDRFRYARVIIGAAMTKSAERRAVLDTSDLVIAELGKMFSSYNDYSKAVVLERYGMTLNTSGTMVVNGEAKWNSMLAAMGVPNADEVMARRQYSHVKNHQQHIDNMSKIVAQLRIQIMLKDTEGDTRAGNFLRNVLSGVFAGIDEADRAEVSRRATSRMTPVMEKALDQPGIPWKVTKEE